MNKKPPIPYLGAVLRSLLDAGGLRPFLTEHGLDKDLDDLATETEGRQSSAYDRLQSIEDDCSEALRKDCGYEWAQTFRSAWFRTRESVQRLAREVDATPIPEKRGNELFATYFATPMLALCLQHCMAQWGGPDVEDLLQRPFHAWVSFAATRSGLEKKRILDGLADAVGIDERTLERWLSGSPISKIVLPCRDTVAAVSDGVLASTDLDLLTGWLVVSRALQSLEPSGRGAVRDHLGSNGGQGWTPEYAICAFMGESRRLGDCAVRQGGGTLLCDIQESFTARPFDGTAVGAQITRLQALLEQVPAHLRASCRYIHDWFSAKHAALLEDREKALRLYAAAVAGSWWAAGPNQESILRDALIYAVGVGDKRAANTYWDKLFLLGLNRAPKRLLDKQEVRRISYRFEQHFAPQKAAIRIPPPVRIIVSDDPFVLGHSDLAHPNQKHKYEGGRIRMTPLMRAIAEGTLGDVQRLVKAGGDPNAAMPESGEGPLSYAMRRACERKDTTIMVYLLGLDLSPETVNRPASTKRETPLKLAVEMANAKAITRLVQLGADVEAACGHMPSALCYAMTCFDWSLNGNDPAQEAAYMAGETPANVYDAKAGTVLDADAATRRQSLGRYLHESERHRRITNAVAAYYIHPPEKCRDVIKALLACGADANRRYRVKQEHLARWTPTLFAAQLGDLDVFRKLVEYPGSNRGEPEQTLVPAGGLETLDALWVALDHQRDAIVAYLSHRHPN